MSHTDLSALRHRLEAAQQDIRSALDQGRTERLPALVATRERDIALLASNLGHQAEMRVWAMDYLARDKEIVARLLAAREATAAKLADMRRARGVHRAYLSSGLAG